MNHDMMIAGTLDHEIALKPREEYELAFPGREDKKRGRKPDHVVRANPEIVESDCERMVQEMEAAYLSDLENNQIGKPSFSKLHVLDKISLKLKNPMFAAFFLDKGGLEQFHNFLKRLPDGSWPLSTIRSKVFKNLLNLPYTEHHLKYTKLGKTLTALQNSKSEYEEHKKIIQEIKDKWSRIVWGIRMDYSNLEAFEKENNRLMKKKRRKTSSKNFVPVAKDGLGTNDLFKTIKMGYNFTIRPYSYVVKRGETTKNGSRTEEIDKYLGKIRRQTRGF